MHLTAHMKLKWWRHDDVIDRFIIDFGISPLMPIDLVHSFQVTFEGTKRFSMFMKFRSLKDSQAYILSKKWRRDDGIRCHVTLA